MFTFMFYDHVSDEMRLRNKFSIENAFKMYKNKSLPKNHLFERPIKFTLVNTYYKQYVDKFKLDFFFKMIFYHFYRITTCFVI
jgi:hypothetical protein